VAMHDISGFYEFNTLYFL